MTATRRKGAVLGAGPVPTRAPRQLADRHRRRHPTEVDALREHADQIAVDDETIVLPADVLASISDYTRSQPTGATPGRVYRRDENWTRQYGPDPEWWIYICDQLPPTALRSRVRRTGEVLPPEDGRGVYHFARRAVVLDA